MHLCVPFTINFYFWHEIVVLANQQEVVKNNTICSSLQKKLEKKRFGAKKRSKSTFLLYKYSKHVSSTMSVFHIYTAKYSILSIFRAKQKNDSQTFKKAMLATVCLCEERIPFELFFHRVKIYFVGFLIPIFASKTECFQYLKKGTFKFSWTFGVRACARIIWKLILCRD